MEAIEVRHLSKRFGPVTAVDDLSFEVTQGSITGFVGPNGAGKSTTLRAILGLVRSDAGEALINGSPYTELPQPWAAVGAVLDVGDFHPGRSARNHLRVLASPAGIPVSRVDEVIEMVELGDAARRAVGGFSLGMRQRLGLAGALLASPEILVLDEPANGLDPEGVRWLRGLLRHHASAGGTALLSSHVIAELALAADHLVVIKAGRLVAQGSVAELTASGAAPVVRVRTPDADKLVAALTSFGLRSDLAPDGDVLVPGANAEDVGRAVARSGAVVYEMRIDRPLLEDVVLELTRGGSET
ncbi:MAG TPA: ATP-binding cassette domain-containing protein [Acidimicrobiia bacterium]|nr:ATP-binding cassette domain-containing protein [Acidimicrobiia bacterium]